MTQNSNQQPLSKNRDVYVNDFDSGLKLQCNWRRMQIKERQESYSESLLSLYLSNTGVTGVVFPQHKMLEQMA